MFVTSSTRSEMTAMPVAGTVAATPGLLFADHGAGRCALRRAGVGGYLHEIEGSVRLNTLRHDSIIIVNSSP